MFIFDYTALYNIGDKQDTINKLIGFSDGTLNHHNNSFRLGWLYSPPKNKIEIYAYVYRDGENERNFLFDVEIFEPVKVDVRCQKDVYRIVLNDYQVFYAKRSTKIRLPYKHMLWPYFGGTVVAPHDIYIQINWLYK
jgi:hypothetical protein